jgi:hypothetical protein
MTICANVIDISENLNKKETPAMVAEDDLNGFVLTSVDVKDREQYISDEDLVKSLYESSDKYPNYFITVNGKVYKLTKSNQSARQLYFNSYSREASIMWPENCPRYEIGEKDCIIPIDTKLLSIALECDSKSNSGKPTYNQELKLKYLIAHYVQKGSIERPIIFNEYIFPNDENLRKTLGHRYYKDNVISLMVLTAKAEKLAKEVNVVLNDDGVSN